MALADIRGGARNEEGIAAALPRLAGRFGTRFQAGEAIRAQHAHTTTYIPAQLPDGVVFVENAEEVKAVVIREKGSSLTEDELVAWSKEQLAAYKYPRIVEFVDALPMTATGKILKREL